MADDARSYPIDIRLENTPKGGRYFMTMPSGEDSRLTFVRTSEHLIVADHTFVPVPYRGHGVAEALVEELVQRARRNGDRISAACWYVADEFARHGDEWADVKA